MTPYAIIFENVRATMAAQDSDDVDAAMALEEKAPDLDRDEKAEFVEDFCSRAGRHVEEIGADAVGGVIWYLMGPQQQVWCNVIEASYEYASAAILSLSSLYERCFSKHLTDWAGVGKDGDRLATACFMLWDMGGGLESVPGLKKPKPLVPACYSVLEHALSLDSPACWKSALHGLGHIVFSYPEPAQGMIDAFLESKGCQVPDDLRAYALSARSGGVQ